MRIALLSNVTTSILEQLLQDDCEVWSPTGFAAWDLTVLASPQDLIDFRPDVVYLILDNHFAHYDADLSERVKARLFELWQGKVPIVQPNLDAFATEIGEGFYDERMWQLAKMPWSLVALKEIKKLILPPKKVIIVDLDNTLWQGVISEDGVDGVTLNEAFLAELKAYKARGVLLAILSRNDEEDAKPVFGKLLDRKDFASVRINIIPKHFSLKSIAEELNLSPDSFVFVDDDPLERTEIRTQWPEVAVSPFPPQLGDYFPFVGHTAEDALRTSFYQSEAERRYFLARFKVRDYLKSLEIKTSIKALTREDIPRVVQLSQRTNQFNLLTKRYDEATYLKYLGDESRMVLTMRVADRFGDYGLVSAIVVHLLEDHSADVEEWVMSCRAMNRGVEKQLEEELERRLKEDGVKMLFSSWQATKKNLPVEFLYANLGFTTIHKSPTFIQYYKEL